MTDTGGPAGRLVPLSCVGRSVVRVDARDKVTGRAAYISDIVVPGMLQASILRSTVPHAQIARLDVSRARALPGVAVVLTGADLRDFDPYYGPAFKDQPLLAIERVRYMGEPVVAVAAVDTATAEEALALIEVEYEDLPVVATVEEALAPDAPLLHDTLRPSGHYRDLSSLRPVPGTNICHTYRLRRGDGEAGLASADVVVEDEFTFPAVQHYSLESFVVVATWASDGLGVLSCTQHPFHVRKELAEMFGLPLHRVRVQVPLIGGGFGQKCYTKLEPLAVALARAAHRPVRVALTIPEAFHTMTRHAARIRIKTAAKRDGTLVGRRVELWLDTGAYADLGPRVTQKAGYRSLGAYRMEHVAIDAHCVYTNKVPAGAFRGYGAPQASWAAESQMNRLAEVLGMDPVELRRKNLLARGETYHPGDTPIDGDLQEGLSRVTRALRWGERVPAGHGRGIAIGFKDGGGTGTVSTSIVRLHADGTATVGAGSVEIGQGIRTALVQVAAEALALPMHHVQAPLPDTDAVPYDQGSSGSRSATLMGYAVLQAALDVRRQLMEIAMRAFEAPADVIRLADGVATAGPRRMAYADLICDHFGMPGGELIGTGAFRPGARSGTLGGGTTFWEVGMAGAEVTVDPETGEVHLLRYISLADVGRAIHPMLCEGQDEGAAMQGIGHTLREELVFDRGQLLNPGLIDYRVPVMEDLPDEFFTILLENGDGPGPYGAKGIGESGLVATAPAVAAAVHAATGVWVRDLPLTPERVWRALRTARAR
jgi:CO/xanthine dehydrogenase Mo-binding subunit